MSVKQEYKDWHEYSKNAWSDALLEGHEDLEYYLGSQISAEEQAWASQEGRILYPVNMIQRQVDLVSGYEQRNRHTLKIGPIGVEDDDPCVQHTKVLMTLMAMFDVYDVMSQAFLFGPLITGHNLLELYRDRDGFIRVGRRPYNGFLLDPALSMQDLSDCEGIATGRWLSERVIKSLLPTRADKIGGIPHITSSNRWSSLPNYHRFADQGMRLYEEWMVPKYKDRKMVRIGDRVMSIKNLNKKAKERGYGPSDTNEIINYLQDNGMPVERYTTQEKWIESKIFVDDEVVWEGPHSLGLGDYPFVWMYGTFVPEVSRSDQKLQGFSRVMRYPQKLQNRRINQIHDIVESQISSGTISRQGALVDPDEVYKAGQGRHVKVKEGFNGGLRDAFDQLSFAGIHPGMFQLLEVMDRYMITSSGLNEEIMGSDDSDIPGILNRYRTGQALTGKQGLFATFRMAKRQLGRKYARLIQLHMPQDKVQRIINEKVHPEFYEEDFTRFDCTPVEGADTDSQRQMAYQEILLLQERFPDIISASDVLEMYPFQGKREIFTNIKKREEQRSRQQQAMYKQQDIMNRLLEAQSAMQLAQARESIADAQEARASAALDSAKTMVEIQKIPQDQRMALLDRFIEVMRINADLQQRQLAANTAKSA
jgi:hypothetical protein